MTATSSSESGAPQERTAMSERNLAAAAEADADPAHAPFNECVFVNCPFDDEFLPLLHAMLFAIIDCGYIPRHAMEDAGAAELRLDKIVRLIRASRLSIHDISRTQLSAGRYPRFNMPFEAGLALGAIRFDRALRRDMLILDAEPYRDKITLSDLAGQDPRAHLNDPFQVVSAVRSFLARKNPREVRTRGAQAIWDRYQAFLRQLPKLARRLELTEQEVKSFAYLDEWQYGMSRWLTSRDTAAPNVSDPHGSRPNGSQAPSCL